MVFRALVNPQSTVVESIALRVSKGLQPVLREAVVKAKVSAPPIRIAPGRLSVAKIKAPTMGFLLRQLFVFRIRAPWNARPSPNRMRVQRIALAVAAEGFAQSMMTVLETRAARPALGSAMELRLR